MVNINKINIVVINYLMRLLGERKLKWHIAENKSRASSPIDTFRSYYVWDDKFEHIYHEFTLDVIALSSEHEIALHENNVEENKSEIYITVNSVKYYIGTLNNSIGLYPHSLKIIRLQKEIQHVHVNEIFDIIENIGKIRMELLDLLTSNYSVANSQLLHNIWLYAGWWCNKKLVYSINHDPIQNKYKIWSSEQRKIIAEYTNIEDILNDANLKICRKMC